MHLTTTPLPPRSAAARHAAIGAALGLLLGIWNTTAQGEIVGVGETLNVTGQASFPTPLGVCMPVCYGPLMMDGGTLRIGDPSTGRALSISATDAILARGSINHWYSQSPGTTFDFFGTTTVLGGAIGTYPADGMYFRASIFDSQGMTVRNNGTFEQSGTGEITLSGTVRFVNPLNSSYIIMNDRGIGGTYGSFLNGGSFIKTAGSGSSRIEVRFDQHGGKVETWSGGIDLLGGGSHADARFYADTLGTNPTGAGFGFGGVHAFNGASTLTETGRFRVIGGSGAINLDSGTWDQKANFEVFGRININPGAILRNTGNMETVGWSSGRIAVSGVGAGDAMFHNAPGGTFYGSLVAEPGFEERFHISNQGQLFVRDGDGVSAGDVHNSGVFSFDSNNVSGRDFTNTGGFFTIRANGYVGARNFVNNGGVLTVDGTLDNDGGTLQLTGGWLAGGGIINGDVFIGGGPAEAVFTPGHSPGTMTINGVFSLLPNGVLEIEIERDPLTGLVVYDRVIAYSYFLDGKVSFLVGSGIDTNDVNNLDFLLGCQLCVSYGGNFSFDFPGRPGSQLIASANGLRIHSLAPVPEPGTYGMLLAGLGLIGVIARRRVGAFREA